MDDIRCIQEKTRLQGILKRAGVTQQTDDILETVIDNLAWQRVKLEDTMEAAKKSTVVVKYSNGGGQEGLRENPIFKGYESLWKSYMAGMKMFIVYLPKDIQEEVENENNVIDLVRKMKEA